MWVIFDVLADGKVVAFNTNWLPPPPDNADKTVGEAAGPGPPPTFADQLVKASTAYMLAFFCLSGTVPWALVAVLVTGARE